MMMASVVHVTTRLGLRPRRRSCGGRSSGGRGSRLVRLGVVLAVLTAVQSLTGAPSAVAAPAFHIAGEVTGLGHQFDHIAVNSRTHKAYVNEPINSSIAVIDGPSRTIAARIPRSVGTVPTAVAVDPGTNTVFATTRDGKLLVIDGTDNTVNATVTVGASPSDIDVDLATHLVYVASIGSASIWVFDPLSGSVTDIPVGGLPIAVAVNSSTHRVYVADNETEGVVVIDTTTDMVTARIPTGTTGWDVAVDAETNAIYVATVGDSVLVIDGVDEIVVASIPLEMAYAVAVDPGTNYLYAASLGGQVLVVDGSDGTHAVTTLASVTVAQATNLAVDVSTHEVYVAAKDDRKVQIISQSH